MPKARAPRKGEQTRAAILDHATDLATQIGLEGLTIGRLATELDLSKSGLFAHFRSKETLQVQVLEAASERFVEQVIRPALTAPRGEARLRSLFERWLAWTRTHSGPGGCLFVAAAAELDDRPGPVRDRLVALQKDWLEVIANVARSGVTDGKFRKNLDCDQLAHDVYSVMLGYHHAARLMRDPQADARARSGFQTLLHAAVRPRRAA
ncbi:MAG: TetR/AcrR family transcriptional regulator [Thermoanaerobaculia bacterium]|nr:TetR/AcrR family transcriptional regulator [Thermoanaerobaculia bacterium]